MRELKLLFTPIRIAAMENVRVAFRIVERVYGIKLGKIVCEERPDTLLHDERLRKAYLT